MSNETSLVEGSVVDAATTTSGEAISIGDASYIIGSDNVVQRVRGHVFSATNFKGNPGELIDTGVIDGIPLPLGLTVISGPADAGKSPLLHHIVAKTGAKLIQFGEPLPGYGRDVGELARALLTERAPIICLDSIKNLVGRLSGAAMSSGISRELFAMLSDWSSFFAERGQTLVTVLNVSTEDMRAAETTASALKSNATAAWFADRTGRITWQARAGSGKKRRAGQAQIVWAGDGLVKRLDSLGGDVVRDDHREDLIDVDSGYVNVEANFSRALTRVIRHGRDKS